VCDNIIIVTTPARLEVGDDGVDDHILVVTSDAEAVKLAEEISSPGDPGLVFIVAKKFVLPEVKGAWATVARGLGNGHAGGE
jgi:hypothetical protein